MLQPATSGSLGGLGPHTRRVRTGTSQTQSQQQSQSQQPEQQQRRESVRILVLGDAGVGKSSLVSAFVSQCFPEKVPSVLTPVQIPASESPDNVATLIVDTSADAPQEQLVARVKEADAIVVVYDASRQETYDRLSSHWLPLIERTLGIPPPLSASQEKERAEDTGEGGGSSAAFPKPVVLAANKVDLLSPTAPSSSTHDTTNIDVSASAGGGLGGDGEATESVRRAQAVMERFRFALQSFDVSAKRQEQVADVFVMAQRLVVYPFGPLFDVASTDLTPKLKRVLARAFRLFDADRDGLLSDAELNALQLHCFKSTLQEEDIKGVKKMVGKGCPGGVRRGGLTQEGFLEVVRLFLFNMQVDMPWAILRTLGYDDELEWESPADWAEMESQLLGRATPEDSSWELTPDALRFLGRVFDQFGAEEGAGGRRVLGREALAEIFSVLPPPALPPWDAIAASSSSSSSPSSPPTWRPTPVISPTTESCVDAAAWVAGWQLTAALHPVTAVRYLLYLGATKAPEELVHPHPRWQRPGRRAPSRRRKSGSGGWGHTHHPPTRAVFHALLFTPSPLFSAHAASSQAATRLFDGLLASHSHGREGLRAGARLLSLQAPEEQARQQSPAPPSSPSSFQTAQTALSTTAMDPVKQAAAASGRGAPGQTVVGLVLEGRAASLAVTAVPAAMTEEGVERALAADVALLPYHPDDPASINRALDLAASLPDALPRVFVELWPPSDQLVPDGVREACAAQPDTHARVVVDMAQQECDALAHEVIAMCHARFGPGPAGGGGRGWRGSVRGGGDGRGLKDMIVGAVRASMEEADPAVVAAVVGVATLGMIVLVARVVGGGARDGGRRG